MGDADDRIIDLSADSYINGVPVGINHKMPRTPAIFHRKTRWRNYDVTDERLDVLNYKSAIEAEEGLENNSGRRNFGNDVPGDTGGC